MKRFEERCSLWFPYRVCDVRDILEHEEASISTVGVWAVIQAAMKESPRPGYLLNESGQPLTLKQISKRAKLKPSYCQVHVEILAKLGYVFCDENGVYSSPRIIRDAVRKQINSENGSKAHSRAYKQEAQGPTTSQSPAPQVKFAQQIAEQIAQPIVQQFAEAREDKSIYIQESSSRDSSVVVPPSATSKTIPQNQKAKPQEPRIVPPLQMDSKFLEFRQAAEARSIRGSELQWTAAYEEYWSKMPLAERIRAKNGLQFREPTEKTEPKFLANPIKYLSSKAWEKYDDLPKPGQPAQAQAPQQSSWAAVANPPDKARLAQLEREAEEQFLREHPELRELEPVVSNQGVRRVH